MSAELLQHYLAHHGANQVLFAIVSQYDTLYVPAGYICAEAVSSASIGIKVHLLLGSQVAVLKQIESEIRAMRGATAEMIGDAQELVAACQARLEEAGHASVEIAESCPTRDSH
eukprot:1124381-Prorocentrum_lima.AAC.1